MKLKIFLDTNVLMDLLQEGRPGSYYSQIIFQMLWEGKLEGVVTTQSIIDISYLAEKTGRMPLFLETVSRWCNHLNVDHLDAFDIRFACQDYHGDFEDDCQFHKAEENCCDVFVTSDKKFRTLYQNKNEHIRFMSPEEFVLKMKGSLSL